MSIYAELGLAPEGHSKSKSIQPIMLHLRGEYRSSVNFHDFLTGQQWDEAIEGMVGRVRQQLLRPRSISDDAPAGWTWHHAVAEGELWLTPSRQHWDSRLWSVLHPVIDGKNRGGMSIWGGGYGR
jgi:hypothetical protein